MSPQRCCTMPGCPYPARPGGRCAGHVAQATAARNQRRAASRDVYLSKRWKKLRRQILHERPYCQHDGCGRPARDVDHVIPLDQGGAPWDPAQLQALCGPHHSEKTAAENHFGGRHD